MALHFYDHEPEIEGRAPGCGSAQALIHLISNQDAEQVLYLLHL